MKKCFFAEREFEMDKKIPCSAAEERENNKPYYIEPDCKKCGSELVLSDLLRNPDVEKDKIWHDEFACPECQDGVYLDIPEEKWEEIFLNKEKIGNVDDLDYIKDLLSSFRAADNEDDKEFFMFALFASKELLEEQFEELKKDKEFDEEFLVEILKEIEAEEYKLKDDSLNFTPEHLTPINKPIYKK